MTGLRLHSDPETLARQLREDLDIRRERITESHRLTGKRAPVFDPWELRLNHRFKTEQIKQMEGKFLMIKQTMACECHMSTASFKSLRAASYTSLEINVQAKGLFLILRTLEQARRLVGLQTIVEDHTGNVCTLAVYNFVTDNAEQSPEEALPIGTILILKEPFLKAGAEGGFIVRCDCPTDIMIVGRDSPFHAIVQKVPWLYQPFGPLPPLQHFSGHTAEEWKGRGNVLFKQKAYKSAKEAYAVALQMTDPITGKEMVNILRLNLAATFLFLGYYEKALECASCVLAKDPGNQKGLFRAGKASYELRQYRLAKERFNLLVDQPEGPKELQKCNERLLEETNGISTYRLYLTSKLKPGTFVESADFMGPVTVTKITGKGRGMVAVQEIQPGTQILACKAIQASYFTNMDEIKALQYNMDNTVDHGGNIRLVSQVTQTVMKNPVVFGSAIYGLTSNSISIDQRKTHCDEDTKEEPIADVERLRKIISTNGFGLKSCETKANGKVSGSGLFVTASYFNHSCVPNACWTVYNDVLVVYAIKHVSLGEEVTIAYMPCELMTFTERTKDFSNRGFVCNCTLCQLDKAELESVRLSRETFVEEERKLMNLYRSNTNAAVSAPTTYVLKQQKKVIEKLEKSYENSKRNQLKTALFNPYMTQATLAISSGFRQRALDAVVKAFACLGVDFENMMCCAQSNNNVTIFDKDAIFSNTMSVVLAAVLELPDVKPAKLWHSGRILCALEVLERVTRGNNQQTVKAKFGNIPDGLFMR